jgi:hypothetical protein
MKTSSSIKIFNVNSKNSINIKEKDMLNHNKNTNIFNVKQNTMNNITKNLKEDTIKVCVRVRPLLGHEDVEFWKPDFENNVLTTVE